MRYNNFIDELKIIERKGKDHIMSELIYDGKTITVLKSKHHLTIDDFLVKRGNDIDNFYSRIV